MIRCVLFIVLLANIAKAQSGFVTGFTIGGLGNETGDAVAVDPFGNFYIAGTYNNTVDFDPSVGVSNVNSFSGNKDIFLAKYDATGILLWANRMGGTSNCAVYSLVADSNYVLLGGSFSGTCDFDPSAATANKTSLGGSDGFVAKYTSNGGYTFAHGFASTQTDEVKAMAIDGNDNIYFTGIVGATADMNPGAAVNNITNTSGFWNAYFGKLDANGNYIFANHINGKSNAYDIVLDKLGRIYIVGEFTQTVDFNPSLVTNNLSASGGASGASGFIARYDNSGNYNWAFRNGGSTTLASFQSLDVDSSGNIYIVGFSNGTIDLDFSVATNNFTSSFGGGYLLKCDSSLAYQWAHMIAGTVQFNPAFEVKVSNNKVYMTGHFNGTNVDFDGTANTQFLSSVKRAAYLAAYNLDGTYAFAQKINDVTSVGSGLDYKDGKIYWIGNFTDSASITLNASGTSSLSNGSNDVFVGAYNISGNPLAINDVPQLICQQGKLFLYCNKLSTYNTVSVSGISNNTSTAINYIATSINNQVQLLSTDFDYFIVNITDDNNQVQSYPLYKACNNSTLDYIINSSLVSVPWDNSIVHTAYIYNAIGQKVVAFTHGTKAVNLPLTTGIYYLQVNNNYKREVVRFVMP
jgi:hypothetical protein